ncbi:putative membrane protein [Escherichia coli 1827-70]|nr:putative membrane protein [Escherichia coli 1827-70]
MTLWLLLASEYLFIMRFIWLRFSAYSSFPVIILFIEFNNDL